ncbi:hypothetical protein Tco_0965892 [Tanacetum coccineum]
MQPLSSNQKSQKVESYTRNAKPSLTKEDSESKSVCLTCNKCYFDARHDLCVVQYLSEVNDRNRAKAVKSIKMKMESYLVKCQKGLDINGYPQKVIQIVPCQNRRYLPRDIPLNRIEVLRYDTKGVQVRKGKMQTKTELTLEQTQQDVSDEVLNIRVIPHSIHNNDGNPTNANIKQALRQEEHPSCSQAKDLVVEEKLVHERMEVRFEVLIEMMKVYLHDLLSCLGGIMVNLIFLEGMEEEALVGFVVEWYEEDKDDDRSGKDGLFN